MFDDGEPRGRYTRRSFAFVHSHLGPLSFPVYLRVVSQGSEKVTQAPLSKPAILKSHKRCSIRDRQYPALVSVPSEPEAKVEGVIRFVPESHVVWLDDWEEVVSI